MLQQGRTTSTPPVRSARQRAAAAEAEANAEAAQTAAATAAAAAEKRKKAAEKRKKDSSGKNSAKDNSGKDSAAKSKVLTLLRGQFVRAVDGKVSRVAADSGKFGWASTDSPVPSKVRVVDGKGSSGMSVMTPNRGARAYAARMAAAAAEADGAPDGGADARRRRSTCGA